MGYAAARGERVDGGDLLPRVVDYGGHLLSGVEGDGGWQAGRDIGSGWRAARHSAGEGRASYLDEVPAGECDCGCGVDVFGAAHDPCAPWKNRISSERKSANTLKEGLSVCSLRSIEIPLPANVWRT